MSSVVEHKKCICVEFGNTNNNKWWEYILFDDGTAETAWGRVGGHTTRKPTSVTKALKKWAEKTRPNNKPDKRYTEVKAVDTGSSSSTSSIKNAALKDVATKQINHNNPLVAKLIDYFVKVNAHQIISQSGGKITYDVSTAQFKTPLGIIVPDQVVEARNLLAKISNFVSSNDFNNKEFNKTLNAYLRLIPHDVGMSKITPELVFPNSNIVIAENTLLDGLDASFAGIIAQPKKKTAKKKDAPKVFEMDLFKVVDKKVIAKISKFFESSKKSMHYGVAKYHVKDIYAMKIASMKKNFDSVKDNIGNVMQLWHGTKASNLLSIFRQGLVIPPSSSSHCTGRMYSDGLYFSSVSTKALNYATNFWGSGGSTNRIFMFLAEVAMGKAYIAGGGWGSYPKAGYDSTWAKGGQSGVLNDEMIVYKLNQANLVYLVEFE